ncbi:hypothetical protein PENANT_c003G07322 [Penicillium antarcticum]|uniref:Uncharacterized protein n=1 Tax=Penicillium antarcticum TaxID=416450 RepID=A0A1V6QJ11_9EURO|nr:uncharacterized protein N7508_005993 [Penicillium antarcticum]KAJ5306978.1 hypothetical protein N7508_005993 [Penicillium antarcticum]OQD88957.1 hypothetical protein PENANT_c003G07322 [Penicillium antarcticum]
MLEGVKAVRDQLSGTLLAAGNRGEFEVVKQMQGVDEEEEEEVNPTQRRGQLRGLPDQYWQDIYTHPLYQQGKEHSIPSIVNIQHALLVAIETGSTEIVTTLLDFGAQPNFCRGNRIQYLYWERDTNWWHATEIDNPPLFTAVQSENLDMVKLLLRRGADPTRYALSPLYSAVEDNRRAILLEHGVGPQSTALKLAVLNRDECMVGFLLDGGLNVTEYGHAALYTAERQGDLHMVNLLKSRGATLKNLFDDERETWEKEDGDGTRRPYYQRMMCTLYEPEVSEESDEEESAAEDVFSIL